jgi:hypothetical protein
MFATVLTAFQDRVRIDQFDAPTVKDCLVAWAGKLDLPGLTGEGRTRLRGQMADFAEAPVKGFGNLWRLETDLGLGGGKSATVVVVESVRP